MFHSHYFCTLLRKMYTLILAIVILSTTPPIFADTYETTSIRFDNLPTMCIINPDTSYTDKSLIYETVSFLAIHQWEKQLKLTSPFNNWDVTVNSFPHTNDVMSYFDSCDVVINFKYSNPDKVTVGKTEIDSISNIALITIYMYQPSLEYTQGISNDDTLYELQTKDIHNAVLHELGHSMGLGHYIFNEQIPIEKKISHTVMNPEFETFGNNTLHITPIDIQKLIKLYPNGFSQK